MPILSRRSVRIFHAEDDPDFAALSLIFLRNAGFDQPITHRQDGVETLRYFSTLKLNQAPHLILLDLHMPHINGLEVLHWLRHGEALRDIPIFLLTSSNEPEDRRRAAAEGVTGYLLKAPVFQNVIQSLDRQIEIMNHRTSLKLTAKGDAETEPFVLLGEDLYFERQPCFLI